VVVIGKKMDEYVQYIVVRRDLVEQMGVGKTAAQVAHASMGVILGKDGISITDNSNVVEWLSGRFTKLVVYAKSKEKLLNLEKKLDEGGIITKLIYNSCFTILKPEEENGTTLTCMGVIPLKKLRLL
jgi:peptidyl-tRNA hydrolase